MNTNDEDRLRFWLNTNVSGIIRIAESDWQTLLTAFAKARAEEREGFAKSELERARHHVITAARALDTSETPLGISSVVTLDRALQRLARAESAPLAGESGGAK